MKKIFYSLVITIIFLLFLPSTFGACDYSEGQSIGTNLDNCLSDSKLVGTDAKIGGGFDNTIKKWTINISLFLGIASVLGIVYGAFSMTISAGEDEKVNKAKDIIKWSIIGFLLIISASFIINLLVRLFYSLI
ncbi:MAG: hypothetical protein PHI37_00015 [Candidatus Gracilibacteria bacterium]|nr:hypothetical protein [Candidatus Gracilibacteria bacterium]